MELKLEITKKLEGIGDSLDKSIAILNLPAANLCEKRAEMVRAADGVLEQACNGCISQNIKIGERLPFGKIKKIIDFFSDNYQTRFLTINGRGNPFHPSLKKETLNKIAYASSKGIQSYVFTAGTNLDEGTCKRLAYYEANVMISLFGNKFIDEEFFKGKRYPSARKPLQNKAKIARNLRMLIKIYGSSKPGKGITRIGMNYVISERDLENESKVKLLKEAANRNGIFLICNTNFLPHPNQRIRKRMQDLAIKNSNFHLRHSTYVNGRCQMGAGSSATVDYNGELYRCPYMDGKGDGKFQELSGNQIKRILSRYMKDRKYACVLRRTGESHDREG